MQPLLKDYYGYHAGSAPVKEKRKLGPMIGVDRTGTTICKVQNSEF